MNNLDRYKRGIVIKCVVIPLIVTAVCVCAFKIFQPQIEGLSPNGIAYAQQEAEESTL